jgi:hypothetical protein
LRNKYKHLGEHVICITPPIGYSKFFTIGKKYKVIRYTYTQISIATDLKNTETFNIHSWFGDSFCSLYYSRRKKLKKLDIKCLNINKEIL